MRSTNHCGKAASPKFLAIFDFSCRHRKSFRILFFQNHKHNQPQISKKILRDSGTALQLNTRLKSSCSACNRRGGGAAFYVGPKGVSGMAVPHIRVGVRVRVSEARWLSLTLQQESSCMLSKSELGLHHLQPQLTERLHLDQFAMHVPFWGPGRIRSVRTTHGDVRHDPRFASVRT